MAKLQQKIDAITNELRYEGIIPSQLGDVLNELNKKPNVFHQASDPALDPNNDVKSGDKWITPEQVEYTRVKDAWLVLSGSGNCSTPHIYIPRLDILSLTSGDEIDTDLMLLPENNPESYKRFLYVRHRHNVDDEFWNYNPRIVLMRRVSTKVNALRNSTWNSYQKKWVCPSLGVDQYAEEPETNGIPLSDSMAYGMMMRNKVGGMGNKKDDAYHSWYCPWFEEGGRVDIGRILKPFVRYFPYGSNQTKFQARIAWARSGRYAKIEENGSGVRTKEFGFCVRIDNPLFVKDDNTTAPGKNYQSYHFEPRYLYGEVTKVTAYFERRENSVIRFNIRP